MSISATASPNLSVLIDHASALADLLRRAKSRQSSNPIATDGINDQEIDQIKVVIKDLSRDLYKMQEHGQTQLVEESVNNVMRKLKEILEEFIKLDPKNTAFYQKLTATNNNYIEYMRQFSFAPPLAPTSVYASSNLELPVSTVYHDRKKDFLQDKVQKLTDVEKRCLYTFSLFPEGSVIERTVLINLWVALDFIDVDSSDRSGKTQAYRALATLARQGFIVRLIRKNKASNSYMMRSGICSQVINSWRREIELLNLSYGEVALLQKSGIFSVDGHRVTESETPNFRLLLNIDKPKFDAAAASLSSFSGMENVHVAHLGGWHHDAEDYIVVEDADFLKALKHMKELRLLSLRGMSGIVQLPLSVYKFPNLRVLDLEACHNLEVLPDGIESLQLLTHLDLSECYLLQSIPKNIIRLANLRVLKGFVINPDADSIVTNKNVENASSCAFCELSELQQLIKLAIRTRRMDFPTQKDVETMGKMGRLKKLTISWVGRSVDTDAQSDHGLQYFPDNLEKLELRAASKVAASKLLQLIDYGKGCLRKLYIIGGELDNLSSEEYCLDGVTQVRLRYLLSLSLDWFRFRQTFPDLIHLDIFQCPKLTDFPCDENGLWTIHV